MRLVRLYQVRSSDARVWAAAIGLILLTAAAGTLVPAVRASRIEPTQALRSEQWSTGHDGHAGEATASR